MKKVLFIISLLICCTSLYAQADRESFSLIRVNGTQTSLCNDSKLKHWVYDNNKMGWSVEVGGKAFLIKGRGFFIEGTAQLYWSRLPVNYIAWGGSDEEFVCCDDGFRETGFGLKAVGGYDFSLGNNFSLEIFGGPVVNYAANFGPKGKDPKNKVHRFNYRLQVGVGLNYKRFNLSFAFSDDFVNRGKTYYDVHYKYRTYSFSVGLAYRFPLFKQINY